MGNHLHWSPQEFEAAQRRQAAKLIGTLAPKVETPATLPAPKARPPTEEDRLNKTERQFLRILQTRGFKMIRIQAITLKLAWDCRYTPDFYTLSHDGQMTFWEVKGGYIREDASIKLKMAANKFTEYKFILAQKNEHRWREEVVPQ